MKNTVSVAIAALAAAIAAKKAETDWKNTQPMPNKPAGIKVTIAATPSRASHDVRHCVNAREKPLGMAKMQHRAHQPGGDQTERKPRKQQSRTKGRAAAGPPGANAASNASNP